VLGLRKITLFLYLLSSVSAVEVYVANTRIAYKQNVNIKNCTKKEVKKLKRHCSPILLKQIQSKKYYAKHIILKNSPICQSDVAIQTQNKVIFNFNDVFEIEKNGKIVRDTKEYVRFRNRDGKIETIYKR
jgi:hypothetical protein